MFLTGAPPPQLSSFPLARGTLYDVEIPPVQMRLIPARAGNTNACARTSLPIRTHPRSRGEHDTSSPSQKCLGGSSPLTRGAHTGSTRHIAELGLIPAHAGSTIFAARSLITIGAHPRSRGEHDGSVRTLCTECGSSPLTRGARIPAFRLVFRRGLIPAHAGSTAGSCIESCSSWAHPRSRGEHVVRKTYALSGVGSSPLTRGAHGPRLRLPLGLGLIPAHAGNTWLVLLISWWCGAHPRSRGEHCGLLIYPATDPGSSPLARGTLCDVDTGIWCSGLIPARAGNTRGGIHAPGWDGAHPRSRGEHTRAGSLP